MHSRAVNIMLYKINITTCSNDTSHYFGYMCQWFSWGFFNIVLSFYVVLTTCNTYTIVLETLPIKHLALAIYTRMLHSFNKTYFLNTSPTSLNLISLFSKTLLRIKTSECTTTFRVVSTRRITSSSSSSNGTRYSARPLVSPYSPS